MKAIWATGISLNSFDTLKKRAKSSLISMKAGETSGFACSTELRPGSFSQQRVFRNPVAASDRLTNRAEKPLRRGTGGASDAVVEDVQYGSFG